MSKQLFEGELIRLAPIDVDKDVKTISQWMHDPEYLRLSSAAPARPLAPVQVKKQIEEMQKQMEKRREVNFVFRTREADRLVGWGGLYDVAWPHGAAMLRLSIGQSQDRGKGYGSEALRMLLYYGFDELSLYRIGAITYEYNLRGQRLLERFGFVLEVRRRQAVQRAGRRWDTLVYGLLREEWTA
jgi:RimJ/RimL family protein N-acetyltransferase